MYSVAQVLSSEFARTWHEAVAIVQEAAYQLHPGLALPGPEDLIIDDVGALTFGFGSESSDSPVAALAGLLDRLLAGVEAPQSLRDLVSQNIGPNPSHGTVASFTQALAFFERPNRVNDIRAIATRLSAVRQKSSSEQEFERLREKVAHAPEPEQKKKEERKNQPRLSKVQQALVVAAVFLLVFGTLGYRSGLHRKFGSLTSGVEGTVQNVVSAGLEKFGVSKAASAAPAPEATLKDEPLEKAAEPAPVRTSGTERAALKASPRQVTAPDPKRPATTERASGNATAAVKPELPAAKPSPSAPNGEVVTVAPAAATVSPAVTPRVGAAPGDGAVFSDDHPEVQAPVLVRPQLPKEPAPGDDTGIFDMLVDENGDVMQVKLISPRRRYHDRMLVAAAKAWKFRPALLNGYPVKYRIQIPIILKGMP